MAIIRCLRIWYFFILQKDGGKMFKIDSCTKHICLTRGNSCKIDILPILIDDNKNESPIILKDEDKLIFTVASPSGRKYLQKVLTADDYDENDESLNLILFPNDTINLQPFDYMYDVVIVYDNGSTVTIVDSAKFSILQAYGTYQDLEKEG